jgi:hypothetical protein
MGVGGQLHAPAAFTPRKDLIPVLQEAGWVPGPVWTGAGNLASTGIRSLNLPALASRYNDTLSRPTLTRIEIDQPRNISISKVGVVTSKLSIDGNRIDITSNKTYLKHHFCRAQHVLEIYWRHNSQIDEIRLTLSHLVVLSSAVTAT